MAISLFTRFVIVVTIVVTLTDIIVFYALQRHNTHMTWLLLILTIIITIIPIVINLWFWLVFKKR